MSLIARFTVYNGAEWQASVTLTIVPARINSIWEPHCNRNRIMRRNGTKCVKLYWLVSGERRDNFVYSFGGLSQCVPTSPSPFLHRDDECHYWRLSIVWMGLIGWKWVLLRYFWRGKGTYANETQSRTKTGGGGVKKSLISLIHFCSYTSNRNWMINKQCIVM